MNYINSKHIVSQSRNKHPEAWFGCDYTMNIYRGCCHGCIYCDSRSDCYHVEDFDNVTAKANSFEIIENDLKSKRFKGIIGTGAMSDPYNPFERNLKLTRNALKLVDKYEFGINIATKSNLVTRDIDVLKPINQHSSTCVGITITTYDENIASIIEPHASSSAERFNAIEHISKNDIFCGILMMPLLPFINDTKDNVLSIVNSAHNSGAKFILPSFGMTNRQGQREYFYSALDKYFPGKKAEYIDKFGDAYECSSPHYAELKKLFVEACTKYKISYKMADIIAGAKNSIKQKQINFFNDI